MVFICGASIEAAHKTLQGRICVSSKFCLTDFMNWPAVQASTLYDKINMIIVLLILVVGYT